MVPEEERAHGTISAKIYFMFFKEGVKSHFITIILIVFFIFVEVRMYIRMYIYIYIYIYIYVYTYVAK